ncbi:MAG TPA: glycosyl hydrolase [Balneolaceae bacterium]|nr:glycosyl hydrolase [Balneolaceae bacterium]
MIRPKQSIIFSLRKKYFQLFITACFLLSAALLSLPARAQIFGHGKPKAKAMYQSVYLRALQYRNIGPYRGGRSDAVAGNKHQSDTYYMGVTGGGVYKTTDDGKTWKNVSDGYFKTGSVGALAVAPSDPNVVYAGMGESTIRGNMQEGDGMYKSTNGGKTWKYIGLGKTRIIGDIVVDPKNPDVVWVAALGQVFGKEGNKERGVYKSTDGGKTWKKVLYLNKKVGAVDIAIDPKNPRVLYASLWQAYRNNWKLSSGGPGSGLYKSIDGGNTWTNITKHAGLPKGIDGKIGVTVSPVKPDRVWAIVENKNGGLFRSDNAGKTWKRVNKSDKIRQRAWYFSDIYASPNNASTVYVENVRFMKSVDGGKSFKTIRTPHSDHHDLWINPKNPARMIIADDGGAQITEDGGKNWSSMYKYATGQFYHVAVDNRFPFRLYGAQQDSGPVQIKSRTDGYGITRDDWQRAAGGESGFVVPDPKNPHITYGGGYDGNLQKYNDQTGERDRIDVWPDNPMGHPASDLKERFQWTFPIAIDSVQPNALYTTSQYVFRSTDGGMSWQKISGDLTRNNKVHQQSSGGPITQDNTSVEYYNTIFAFAESPVKKGVLWAGSDGGLVHLSRDNGKTWKNVTPDGMPEARIEIIDPSPFDPATAYMAVNRHKFGDFKPMLYKTHNYGKSWTKITNGIPDKDYTRVIREDPNKKGLLYAGTETGIYVSFNDGRQWQPLKLNMPAVGITDMKIQKRANDLAISTMGRGFWILDDLNVLQQISKKTTQQNHLYKPKDTYLFGGPSFHHSGTTVGQNPKPGVVVDYNLKDTTHKVVKLQFLDGSGNVIRTYASNKDIHGHPVKKSSKFYPRKNHTQPTVLPTHKGLNEFSWNMRYPGATKLKGPQVLWAGTTRGPKAVPGSYKVRLIINGKTVMTQPFRIKKDPRIQTSQSDFQAQFDLEKKIVAKLDTTQKTLNKISKVRKRIKDQKSNYPKNKEVQQRADTLLHTLSDAENALLQTKNTSSEDALNYPIKLRDKLAALNNTVGTGHNRPTKQQYQVFQLLSNKIDAQLKKVYPVLTGDIPTLLHEPNQ